MTQKLVVGLLVLTVLGAVVVGVYDASRGEEVDASERVLAELAATSATNSITQAVTTNSTTPVAGQAVPQMDALPVAQTGTQPATQTAPVQGEPVQQAAAVDMVGEPWRGSGSIQALDTNGMTLALSMAESVYVELGPPHAWQDAGVTLVPGDFVTVDGFFNGQQYHAAMVTKADNTQLLLRTTEGQPLWAGGANGGQAQGANGQQGEPQVTQDQWITLEGTVTAMLGSTLTMQTAGGDVLDLQLGQQRFIDSQGVVFAPGDAIRVLGFWQGTLFKAGEITNTRTGARLMLLDPNGRPLWGGPGRNGAGGQGGGQGTATTTDTLTGTPATAQGGGNGGGNGYQGGRNPDFQRGGQGGGNGVNNATATSGW